MNTMEMYAIDRLLKLEGRPIHVMKTIDGKYSVRYENCEIKNGMMLIGTHGIGLTFDQACYDYLNKISGKTLVFNANGDNRKEVTVLF